MTQSPKLFLRFVTSCTAAVCVLTSGEANASFLGVGFAPSSALTSMAQSTSGVPAGAKVHVLYAAFNNPDDRFLNIFNVNFASNSGTTLYQNPSGGDLPSSQIAIGFFPALRFDSFVTVGGFTTDEIGIGVGVVGTGIQFTTTGITGNSAWHTVPSTGLGTPVPVLSGTLLGDISVVVLGQFTYSDFTTISGDYELSWNDPIGRTTQLKGSTLTGNPSNGFRFLFGDFPFPVPTPGTGIALLAGLGLTSRRRRS